MIIVDRIAEDLVNVYNCYENASRLNLENPEAIRLPAACFYPGLFEVVMTSLIPLNIVTGLYRLQNGTLYWDEFTPGILTPLHSVKYSPILVAAATALAARHSKGALATLVGVYVIKKIIP